MLHRVTLTGLDMLCADHSTLTVLAEHLLTLTGLDRLCADHSTLLVSCTCLTSDIPPIIIFLLHGFSANSHLFNLQPD